MTDKYDERAKEIANKIMMDARLRQGSAVETIAAALREAVEEAYHRGFSDHTIRTNFNVDLVAKYASEKTYADAAKIADAVCIICPDEDGDYCPASNHSAAKAIRARAQEVAG